MIAVAVIWVVMGFISGVIASSKGNSFGGYFLVGVLLGPIGIIIAAVASPQDRSLPAPGGPEAGWYPDPAHRHEMRYWDGYRWTDHVADQGVQGTDPAKI